MKLYKYFSQDIQSKIDEKVSTNIHKYKKKIIHPILITNVKNFYIKKLFKLYDFKKLELELYNWLNIPNINWDAYKLKHKFIGLFETMYFNIKDTKEFFNNSSNFIHLCLISLNIDQLLDFFNYIILII
tara:strand:+ start:4858 stop:5244 length:387 start_codon:yes stop_codon:yes gene_type:complete